MRMCDNCALSGSIRMNWSYTDSAERTCQQCSFVKEHLAEDKVEPSNWTPIGCLHITGETPFEPNPLHPCAICGRELRYHYRCLHCELRLKDANKTSTLYVAQEVAL